MKMKNKIFCISIAIIIIGIIVACLSGFELGFDYGKHTRMSIQMLKETNLDEIEQIVKENFNGKYKIEYTDDFKDTILIRAKDITGEELDKIEAKIKENYEFKEDTEPVTVTRVPNVRVIDSVKQYITPIAISLVIILIYFGIAYRKQGVYKSIIEPLIEIILIGGVFASIIAIFRIPLDAYIIPLGILIYIVGMLAITLDLNHNK